MWHHVLQQANHVLKGSFNEFLGHLAAWSTLWELLA